MMRVGGLFRTQLRVKLPETYALGVVCYGQNYTYFDMARLETLPKVGVTLTFLRKRGLGFVAAAASCRYHSSAFIDDLLTLEVGVESIGKAGETFSHLVRGGRERLAVGRVTA